MARRVFALSVVLGLLAFGLALSSCVGDDDDEEVEVVGSQASGNESDSGRSGEDGDSSADDDSDSSTEDDGDSSTDGDTSDDGYEVSGTIGGHDYVEMGLSVRWAACNMGASSAEDYGDYYAWGVPETKSSYTSDDCLTWKKYVGDISGSWRDAAHAEWGGSWRMPTVDEFDELLDADKCTWTWTTKGGVRGYRVTSKRTGNSIFLPAAGYRYGESLISAGQLGDYWSSTPRSGDKESAWELGFGVGEIGTYWLSRYLGQSVRPVVD